MSDKQPDLGAGFSVQGNVRGVWRSYLDELAPVRPALYQHCCKLTGSIWDAEDLVQDTLLRVFSLLGKIDADLENPKAYLTKTATNLWIDGVRRRTKERAILAVEKSIDDEHDENPGDDIAANLDASIAAGRLIQKLHPQERAAVVLKDLLDYSLRDTAEILNTTVGAIKSALHRGRSRLDERLEPTRFAAPDKVLVGAFMDALQNTDLQSLKKICAVDLTVELVGGAETRSFDDSQMFFQHAHFVMPELGFGENPHWILTDYLGEPVVVGFRTLNDVEGINEVHRLEVIDGKITRVRCYCFCPDTLRALGEDMGEASLARPYRSPSPEDYAG